MFKGVEDNDLGMDVFTISIVSSVVFFFSHAHFRSLFSFL